MKQLRTSLRVALGVCAVTLPVLVGCSFSLTERMLCADAGSCTPTPPVVDMTVPPDLLNPRTDPNEAGPFQVASQELTVPTTLGLAQNKLTLVWPSDDGMTPSTKNPSYPLVVMLPAQSLPIVQLRSYADRLASHGIATALVKVSDERKQVGYRDSVLALLPHLTQSSEIKDKLIADHVGIFGYQLGGEVALSALGKTKLAIRSALVIDPVAVLSYVEPLDGLADAASISQGQDAPLMILGELISKVSSEPGISPCTPPGANFEAFYDRTGGSAAAITFGGATLGDFVSAYPDSCGLASADRATTLRLAVKLTTAYFQWTLLGKDAAKDYLFGSSWNLDRSRYGLDQVKKGL